MRKLVLFDLDQTLIDSQVALPLRRRRQWSAVYAVIPTFKSYDGIDAMWTNLCEGRFTTGIVTSSPRTYCIRVLKHLQISPDITVCYHDTHRHKPHPAPLQKALSKAGAVPENALYVGDSRSDMEAASASGMLGIGAAWGGKHPGSLADVASYLFETPGNFSKWLRGDLLI